MSEFLAEASVLVRANTEAFRAKLLADVAAAVKEAEAIARVAVVPIVAKGANTAKQVAAETAAASKLAAASRTEEANAALTVAGAEQKLASLRSGTAAAASASYSKVERALVAARLQGVTVVDGLVANEIGLAEATAAGTAAREFLTTAELQGVDSARLLEITAIREAVAMGDAAAATRLKALADEEAAAAAGHHTVALKNVGRGSITAALAAVGLRGATLTANAAFITGAAAAIGFGKAISTSMKFETSLNVFAATVGATGDQMQRVSEQARQLGADITLPSVNAQDAADAMSELAKAGLSVEDSISGARGVLQLATAASIDNAQATQIAASALNAFGLAGTDAVHVADVLANAANESQGSISDVGLSLQQAAAVSRQVGVSFEDTAALLTLLARNGIRGSDAGTSLRVAFTRLINPSEKARKILEGLNIQLRDAQGNLRPEVFSEFAQAQSRLSRSQQDANAGIVFGTDALRAYSIFAREGTGGLNDLRGALEKQGTAAELAGARTKGLAGSVENLKNQLSTFGLAIGDAAKGPLKDFVDILAGGFENINAGIAFLNRLSGEADNASRSFAELAQQAGRINFAVAARGGKAGPGLLEEQQKLNKALEESLGPGVEATRMIEGYRDALASAAAQAEGLRNRIDETTDRFARQPTPAAPTGPRPIGPTARAERDIALAQARGDLAEVERLQKDALDRARRALAKSHGNVKQRTALFEKVTQAEVALATTQKQIADQAAQDIKQKANDAKAAQAKADQAVLDAFAPAQNRIDIAEIRANQTETLKDDLAVQVAVARQAAREIAIIDKTVKDAQTKNNAIAERVKILARANAVSDSLRKQIADQAKERARQARDALTETLGKRLELAELKGGRDIVLAAFDKAIADAKQRVKNWKKLGLVQLDEQIALQRLINDRKDFLDQLAKDTKAGAGQATTAFDLLKQFTDSFNQTAGNLIGPDQPFVGPTGFTSAISPFLVRRPVPTAAQRFPGKAADNVLVGPVNELAAAVRENTAALRGNTSTGKGITVPRLPTSRRMFVEAHQTREAVEATNG